MIAFYYALTGFAAPIYYRHELFNGPRAVRTVGIGVFGGMALLGLGFFVADIWSTQGNAWTALFDKSSFANLVATVCAWVGTAGIIIGTITAVARNRSTEEPDPGWRRQHDRGPGARLGVLQERDRPLRPRQLGVRGFLVRPGPPVRDRDRLAAGRASC